MPALLAAIAAVLVTAALWPSHGTFHPVALALVTGGAVAALLAVVAGRRGSRQDGPPVEKATRAVLLLGLALGLGAQVLELPGSRLAPARHPYFGSLAWVAVALALTYLLPRPGERLVRWRFPALVGLFLLMGATLIVTEPLPRVDVWMFQENGSAALWHGQNPYELVFPNIYRHDRFYGPGVLENGQVVVYPYPPLVAALEIPALLAGDVRWALLAAMALGAWLASRLAPRPLGELAALVALFQPRGAYVLLMSWTEPLTFAAWAAALVALARWRAAPARGWVLAALAAALLLSTKQYVPLVAWPLLLAAPAAGRWRAAGLAVALTALAMIPFVAWNPAEFWRDVVACQFSQPFRPDALSWLAAAARAGLGTPSAAVGFALAFAVVLLGPGRSPSPSHAAACAAAGFLLFLLFNKQAFCNYYWLAGGLLATAAAAAAPRQGAAVAPPPDTAPAPAA